MSITSSALALSVRVDITNATKDEKLSRYPFKIHAVELDKYKGIKIIETRELRTDPSGTFTGEIKIFSGEAIVGEVNYRGISYYSPLVYIKKEQQEYILNLNVYEITDKMKDIEISQRTMMITPYNDKTIIVYDTLHIENSSRLTYVGRYNDKLKINQTLFIPLPAGYSLISVSGVDQQEIYPLSEGVVSHNEIPPGKQFISLKYFIESDIGMFDVSLHGGDYSPPAKKISIFFTNKEKWRVKSSNLQHKGERKFEGGVYGTYHVWEGTEMRNIDFKVLGPSYKGIFNLWQVSILAAFVVIGVSLVLMKDKIYKWQLIKEKRRLEKILARLKHEADEEDLKGYYLSFRRVLENRKREIEEKIGA
jgi:hypothetical protein